MTSGIHGEGGDDVRRRPRKIHNSQRGRSVFGAGLTSVTTLDGSHSEWIQAGHYTNNKHDYWGANDYVWRNAGMLYSY